MKSVFLGNEEIKRVYSPTTINTLKKEANLSDEIFSKEDVLNDKAQGADYIFSTWGMPRFTESEIKAHLPNLKAVFYAAGSVQNFAREFLKNDVKVFSAWSANAIPVAEFATSQILLSNKGFFKVNSIKNKGEYCALHEKFQEFPGNFNTTVGIIGVGMIGKMVVNRLKNHAIKIKAYDPFLPQKVADELNIKLCSLDEIFETCQTISNHLADNDDTKGLLNYSLFSKMKNNATFINTARGAQVVENDLIKALKEKSDVTAILDVTLDEPPHDDSELYALKNVILTPHMAGSSGDEVMRMSEYMLDEFRLFSQNKSTNFEVTLEMLKTMA